MNNLKFRKSEYVFEYDVLCDPQKDLKVSDTTFKRKSSTNVYTVIFPLFAHPFQGTQTFITALTFIYGPHTKVTTPESPDSLMFPYHSSHLI